jgi:hypothetical protein
MPSESLLSDAFAAAAPTIGEFRSALVDALEDVRAFLERHHDPAEGRRERVEAQLGAFGSGRIDPDRFSALLTAPESIAADDLRYAERAHGTLASIESERDDLFVVRVPDGGDLYEAVARRLAEIGRLFGVMRAITPLLEGQGSADDPSRYERGFPFGAWSRAERSFAPPLVVDVGGGDLVASPLSALLEGGQKLVIVARGETAPAPLSRLISPGTFVVQATDAGALRRAMEHTGPAVALLAHRGIVPFAHDPGGGESYHERITLNGELPEAGAMAAGGTKSPSRQEEDVAHLRALVAVREPQDEPQALPSTGIVPSPGDSPAPPPPPVGVTVGTEPHGGQGSEDETVDRLAAWLLRQAGMVPGA